jgi:hypothetical protein
MSQERRQHVRIPLQASITIVAPGGDVTAQIVNLSRRGFLLKSAHPFEKGASLRMRFLWPPARLCMANGTIIRSDRDRHGISLDDWNEPFEHFVQALELCEGEEVKEVWGSLISRTIEIAKAK